MYNKLKQANAAKNIQRAYRRKEREQAKKIAKEREKIAEQNHRNRMEQARQKASAEQIQRVQRGIRGREKAAKRKAEKEKRIAEERKKEEEKQEHDERNIISEKLIMLPSLDLTSILKILEQARYQKNKELIKLALEYTRDTIINPTSNPSEKQKAETQAQKNIINKVYGKSKPTHVVSMNHIINFIFVHIPNNLKNYSVDEKKLNGLIQELSTPQSTGNGITSGNVKQKIDIIEGRNKQSQFTRSTLQSGTQRGLSTGMNNTSGERKFNKKGKLKPGKLKPGKLKRGKSRINLTEGSRSGSSLSRINKNQMNNLTRQLTNFHKEKIQAGNAIEEAAKAAQETAKAAQYAAEAAERNKEKAKGATTLEEAETAAEAKAEAAKAAQDAAEAAAKAKLLENKAKSQHHKHKWQQKQHKMQQKQRQKQKQQRTKQQKQRTKHKRQ